MKTKILSILFLFFFSISFAQKIEYATILIPDTLKQNANAVIRLSQLEVTISSQKAMTLKSKKVTTVLNEYGLNNLDLTEYYDKNKSINKIEATVYDSFGNEIKTYKRRDFKDTSVADGISIFNDSRALYLDYTPTSYPFTMVFETEIETSNTAFIPAWSPFDGYFVSTEKTFLTINAKPELHLRKKEVNFSDSQKIEKKETGNSSIVYLATKIAAIKREELSPEFINIVPVVYFALENFALENVTGSAANWSDFGKWYYDSLLSDTEEISEDTKEKIKQLVGTEKNPVEIAKIIYKYVQNKTRYVSIQVGIGGWKPMLAKDVDRLGYGDCKALTNYTRTLLKAVGVLSYYTVVYSGNEKKNIQEDFTSIQGDHIILALPTPKEIIWLECTSQTQPFGFQGNFTDDRDVLLVKPEGGEIVRTKLFSETENSKTVKGFYTISPEGNLSGKVKIISKGLQYDTAFGKERMNTEAQKEGYKDEFANINNLKINKVIYSNDKEKIEFAEDLELEAEGYAKNSGGKLLFALNAFDQNSFLPKKYKTRQLPFEILRGYTNSDEIEITIPNGFLVEAKPSGAELNTEFGSYKIEFIVVSPTTILCKRKLLLKKGLFDKSNYDNYRKFRELIAKNDNSKIVIAKI